MRVSKFRGGIDSYCKWVQKSHALSQFLQSLDAFFWLVGWGLTLPTESSTLKHSIVCNSKLEYTIVHYGVF